MTLRLTDHWIWDFWIADTGTEYHIFFLKAPKSLGDPEHRHANATVGHAVSDDLRIWSLFPDALTAGEPGTWDDRAIWTGSVIEADGVWHMLYTGTCLAEGGAIQRIGLATSSDLASWTRQGSGPLIEADPRWYEKLGDSKWPEEAWRDPWIILEGGRFHALITARSNAGASVHRGVIGHAISDDLRAWETQSPLSEGGRFSHLEVPQVVDTGDGHVLVFSCEASRVESKRDGRSENGRGDLTYVASAAGALGPFQVSEAKPALQRGLYSGRLVKARDGSWVWLAFTASDGEGVFVGEIPDPIPWVVS
jgi:beta-fructofuranosidase